MVNPREQRLAALREQLKEVKQRDSDGDNPFITHLSFQIIKLEKSLHILQPEDQNSVIGNMMEYAYEMKTQQKDRRVAKDTFKKILQFDSKNPDANYRYAFLHYEEGDWMTAITHFQKATLDDNEDFPLSDDQLVKAHLFMSYCAVKFAKESMCVADQLLEGEDDLVAEGISIDDLSSKLKTMLDNTELRLFSRQGEKLISKQEYEALQSTIDEYALLLDLTSNTSFVKKGSHSKEISRQNSVLLKQLLLKSIDDDALLLSEIMGYQEEEIANIHDVNWASYRQKVSRINSRLVDIGFPPRLIKSIPRTYSCKIEPVNFYIVQFDAK